MSDIKLTPTETIHLINMYKSKECLWNYKSSLYKRCDLKKKAWEDIAREFGKGVVDVKKKLKHLRSAYVAEKKKVDDWKRSGAGIEEVYEPHLFYFNEFSFLDKVIVIRKTHSNFSLDDTLEHAVGLREETQVTESEDISSPTPSPAISIGSGRKPSARRHTFANTSKDNKYEDAVAAILSSTVSTLGSRSKYADFGNSIASQLENLSPIEAAAAMADLQRVMSQHVVKSLQKQSGASSSSSLSSSSECNDQLQNAMITADIYDEF